MLVNTNWFSIVHNFNAISYITIVSSTIVESDALSHHACHLPGIQYWPLVPETDQQQQ
jgi:hypothetical protein